jgi:hypothetical protein
MIKNEITVISAETDETIVIFDVFDDEETRVNSYGGGYPKPCGIS